MYDDFNLKITLRSSRFIQTYVNVVRFKKRQKCYTVFRPLHILLRHLAAKASYAHLSRTCDTLIARGGNR